MVLGERYYSYNKARNPDWQSDTNRLVAIDLQGFAGLWAANTAPTASNGSVLTSANVAYTFAAADFNFADTDSGDTLEKVKIVALDPLPAPWPSSGSRP